MDFWNHKVNVSKEAAIQQTRIINTFSPEKRFNIALQFAGMGIQQTRNWIKTNNPSFSQLEINLEFVRLMYYQTGEISEEHWLFYQKTMQKKFAKTGQSGFGI